MKSILIILHFIMACLITLPVTAQGLLLWSTGGGTAMAGNHVLTYSFGEPFVLSNVQDNHWSTEGFQQPDAVNLMVRHETISGSDDIRVYPNPTDGLLHIQFENTPGPGSIRVTDMTGTVLRHMLMDESMTYTIQMHTLAPGLYHIAIVRRAGPPMMTSCIKL